MEFKDTFENLKGRATDLAQAGVAQTRRLTEIAKLKMANMSEEDAIKKAYLEIGKLYYAEQGAAPDGAFAAACERITASKAIIETNNERIAELKSHEDPEVETEVDVEVEVEDGEVEVQIEEKQEESPAVEESPVEEAPAEEDKQD